MLRRQQIVLLMMVSLMLMACSPRPKPSAAPSATPTPMLPTDQTPTATLASYTGTPVLTACNTNLPAIDRTQSAVEVLGSRQATLSGVEGVVRLCYPSFIADHAQVTPVPCGSTGKLASNIGVYITDGSTETVTDANGLFQIELHPGSYGIRIGGMGEITPMGWLTTVAEHEITITEGQMLCLDVMLVFYLT